MNDRAQGASGEREPTDFERLTASWSLGKTAPIRDCLQNVSGGERRDSFRDLLRQEILALRHQGVNPQEADYVREYPEFSDVVSEVFKDRNSIEETAPLPAREPPETVDLKTAHADTDWLLQQNRRTPHLQRLGDYDLLEQIGKGGMGVVYRAYQRSADRIVALKVIRPEKLAGLDDSRNRETVERFRIESRAAAQLAHDNIATVFDVGEIDGRHYYSMRYVEGTSLAELVRDAGPLPSRRATGYMQQVASALHEAHQHGVLHRDLKPHNILLDKKADRPLIADFGLAKFMQTERGVTMTGDVFGSPPFMSPEQARDAANVTTSTDVYAIGATLYSLICGKPPFQAGSVGETLNLVITRDPVAPRSHQSSIDRDLETICLKCLEKEPSKRYASAAEVAAELQRYLNGEPIEARPVSVIERTVRLAQRFPVVATLLVVAILCAIAATAASTIGYLRVASALNAQSIALANESEARKELQDQADDLLAAKQTAEVKEKVANDARAKAKQESEKRRESLYLAQIRQAQRSLEEGDVLMARSILETLRPGRNESDLRGFEWFYLWRQVNNHGRLIADQLAKINAVAWSPDTQTVAVTQDARILILDHETGDTLHVLESRSGPINTIAFSSDGELLASGAGGPNQKGKITIWQVATASILHQMEESNPVTSLAFLPKTNQLVAASSRLNAAANTPGARFDTADGFGKVQIWDASTGQAVRELPDLPNTGLLSVACSQDGRWVAAGDHQGAVYLWDLPAEQLSRTLPGMPGHVWDLAFSRDSLNLACGSGSFADVGEVRIYDPESGRTLQSMHMHDGAVFAVDYSPRGDVLATAGWDRIIRVWRADAARDPVRNRNRRADLRATIYGHTNAIRSLAFSPDGEDLLTGTHQVRSDLPDVLQRWTLRNQTDIIETGVSNSVSYRYNRDALGGKAKLSSRSTAMGQLSTDRRSVFVSSFTTGESQKIDCDFPIQAVVFSPDNSKLLLAGRNVPTEVWDWKRRKLLYRLDIGSLKFALFASDAPTLITGSFYKQATAVVSYWDSETGEPLEKVAGETARWRFEANPPELSSNFEASYLGFPSQSVSSLASSIPGISSFDIDTAKHGRMRTFRSMNGYNRTAFVDSSGDLFWIRHARAVSAHSHFSPQGNLAITSPYQRRPTTITDLTNRSTIAELDCYLTGGQFSPDGRLLITAEGAPIARLLDGRSGEEVARLEGHSDVVWDATISPDGRRAVTSSWDGTVKIWDTRDGQLIVTLKTPLGEMWSVWFSDDGRQLFAYDDPDTFFVIRSEGWPDEKNATSTIDQTVLTSSAKQAPIRQFSTEVLTEAEEAQIEDLRAAIRSNSATESNLSLVLFGDGATDQVANALTSLNRTGLWRLADQVEKGGFVPEHVSHRQRVNLSIQNAAITDEGLQSILQWDRLAELSIYDCPNISAVGMSALGDAKHLRRLAISGLSLDAMSADAVAAIGKLRNLRELSLETPVDAAGSKHWESLPLLERLTLNGVDPALLRLCPSDALPILEQVAITGSVDAEQLKAISKIDSLVSLELSDVANLNSDDFQALAAFEHLEELAIRFQRDEKPSSDALAAIAKIKTLRRLLLGGDETIDVSFLSRMSGLESIRFLAPVNAATWLATPENQRSRQISRSNRLKSIFLYESATSETVAMLATAPALDRIELHDASSLTRDHFTQFAETPQLTRLMVAWPTEATVPLEAMGALQASQSLSQLRIRGNLNEPIIESISKFRNLKLLDVTDPRLSKELIRQCCEIDGLAILGLQGPVTDSCIDILLGLNDRPQLKTLMLTSCRISDEGLAKLALLKHLDELQLGGPYLTESGVKELGKSLPKTRLTMFAVGNMAKADPVDFPVSTHNTVTAIVRQLGGVTACESRLRRQTEGLENLLKTSAEKDVIQGRGTVQLQLGMLYAIALRDFEQAESAFRSNIVHLLKYDADSPADLNLFKLLNLSRENLRLCLAAEGRHDEAAEVLQVESDCFVRVLHSVDESVGADKVKVLLQLSNAQRSRLVNSVNRTQQDAVLIESLKRLTEWDNAYMKLAPASSVAMKRLLQSYDDLIMQLVALPDTDALVAYNVLQWARENARSHPDDIQTTNTFAAALIHSGFFAKAAEELQPTVNRKIVDSSAMLLMAIAQQKTGNNAEARQWLDRAVDAIPMDSPAKSTSRSLLNVANEMIDLPAEQ